jgi:hypothetical protein
MRQHVPRQLSAVAVPLYAPRDRCSRTKKCGLFPLPRCARRATPWTRDGAPAHLYDSGTRMRRFGGCFARCYRRHMFRRPFFCTHPSSTAAFQRKDTSHSPGKCCFFLPRCSSPVALCLWRAWLLSFGSFGAKSPSTIFLAIWANTRRENRISFFLQSCAGKILGVRSNVLKLASWRAELVPNSRQKKRHRVFCLLSRNFLIFACQSSVLSSEPGLNVLSGSACLCYRVYIQGMLGTAIIIPSYALAAAISP